MARALVSLLPRGMSLPWSPGWRWDNVRHSVMGGGGKEWLEWACWCRAGLSTGTFYYSSVWTGAVGVPRLSYSEFQEASRSATISTFRGER